MTLINFTQKKGVDSEFFIITIANFQFYITYDLKCYVWLNKGVNKECY